MKYTIHKYILKNSIYALKTHKKNNYAHTHTKKK